jgi:hypothetical protein
VLRMARGLALIGLSQIHDVKGGPEVLPLTVAD